MVAAYLHLARTVCRRAERLIVGLADAEPIGAAVDPLRQPPVGCAVRDEPPRRAPLRRARAALGAGKRPQRRPGSVGRSVEPVGGAAARRRRLVGKRRKTTRRRRALRLRERSESGHSAETGGVGPQVQTPFGHEQPVVGLAGRAHPARTVPHQRRSRLDRCRGSRATIRPDTRGRSAVPANGWLQARRATRVGRRAGRRPLVSHLESVAHDDAATRRRTPTDRRGWGGRWKRRNRRSCRTRRARR